MPAAPLSIRRTLRLIRRLPPAHLLDAGAVLGLAELPTYAAALFGGSAEPAPVVAYLVLAATLLILPLAVAASTAALAESLVSTRADPPATGLGGWLRLGLRRLPGLVGLTLIVGLLVMASLMLLIVPGIYVALTTLLAPVSYLREGLSLRSAIGRSEDLMNGGRLAALALSALVGLVMLPLAAVQEAFASPTVDFLTGLVASIASISLTAAIYAQRAPDLAPHLIEA